MNTKSIYRGQIVRVTKIDVDSMQGREPHPDPFMHEGLVGVVMKPFAHVEGEGDYKLILHRVRLVLPHGSWFKDFELANYEFEQFVPSTMSQDAGMARR